MGGVVEGGCRGIRTLEMLGTTVEKGWSLHGYGVRVEWLGRCLLRDCLSAMIPKGFVSNEHG